jgi:UPF0176 protein
MLEDPNTIVVDFRNHYESEVGILKGLLLRMLKTFRESLPIINEQLQDFKEDKNLLMYCTGGIRCEKASAYFKHQGFKNVFQLEGGIIEYTRQIKEENIESKFIGKNFVFDHRLGERITDDIIAQCHQCGKPCDNHTNCANDAVIYYLSNVMNVKQQWKTVVQQNVWKPSIYLGKNKLQEEKDCRLEIKFSEKENLKL